ncbi:uncharacterized protein LOC127102683 [Lathyrus oleraceus]|uniref:uncharacterized protein LOC127102683 n=1 Tax=Pisum sativum TaxID=3888 RepID=UPI0021D2F4C5|nr:uncharacterized protein LOC127102683 [Pisum sativum]
MYEYIDYKKWLLMQTYVLTVELILNDEELQILTLLEVEKILQTNLRTLKDFRPIPYPNGYVLEQLGNRLIYDERNYNVSALKTEFANMFASQNSVCNIEPKDDLAEMLRQTQLIIWDEGLMTHKHCFESLDRTLRDIMDNHPNSNSIFSGKVIVFGGDFRQILPVVPRGTSSNIVHGSLNVSYIWNDCEVLTLTRNMKLQSGSNPTECLEIEQFLKWLLNIGEGKVSEPNDGYVKFDITSEILISSFNDPIKAIMESTYLSFMDNYHSYDYLKSRDILAAKIEIVDQINEHVLALMSGEARDYYNSNLIDRS